MLLARKLPDQVHHELILAHRTGQGTWDLAPLIAEDPDADQPCNTPPNAEGQQCAYDYRRYHPLVLLAGADELRALYLAIRRQGTLVSQCVFMPFQMCFWTPLSDTSTSELRVAWPQSQPDEHQVAATDVFTDRATGRLDGAGDIHLAFYDDPPASGDPVVRYLRIGS